MPVTSSSDLDCATMALQGGDARFQVGDFVRVHVAPHVGVTVGSADARIAKWSGTGCTPSMVR